MTLHDLLICGWGIDPTSFGFMRIENIVNTMNMKKINYFICKSLVSLCGSVSTHTACIAVVYCGTGFCKWLSETLFDSRLTFQLWSYTLGAITLRFKVQRWVMCVSRVTVATTILQNLSLSLSYVENAIPSWLILSLQPSASPALPLYAPMSSL